MFKKNPHVSGPVQFKPILFKGQLYNCTIQLFNTSIIYLISNNTMRKIIYIYQKQLQQGGQSHLHNMQSLKGAYYSPYVYIGTQLNINHKDIKVIFFFDDSIIPKWEK